MRPAEAAVYFGVSVKTLRRWEQSGKVQVTRTRGNHRRFAKPQPLMRLRPRCVLYARVSSSKQEEAGNLARQLERLQEAAAERGYEVVQTIREQASSLNEKRRGVNKLLCLVESQAVDVVLIEFPDRLARFGFSYLEKLCAWKQVRLEVVEPPANQEPTEALMTDMLSLVTLFSGKLYGHRAHAVRKRRMADQPERQAA